MKFGPVHIGAPRKFLNTLASPSGSSAIMRAVLRGRNMRRKPEHWLVSEWKRFRAFIQDPLTWIMTVLITLGVGLMLRFLFVATDNFGAVYAMPYACAAEFTQVRLFFLSLLAPMFFVALLLFIGEFGLVLGQKRQRRRYSLKFLLIYFFSMIALGTASFLLLQCA